MSDLTIDLGHAQITELDPFVGQNGVATVRSWGTVELPELVDDDGYKAQLWIQLRREIALTANGDFDRDAVRYPIFETFVAEVGGFACLSRLACDEQNYYQQKLRGFTNQLRK